ncbi:MAG: hypothetical protein KAG45_10945, partial [Methyloprofundus sp.]|nr:hypothetical protein [Methyloprofundus sp.]
IIGKLQYKDSMALIDCLDKLEKLEIITQADQWMNYRTIRNKLTHEYSTNTGRNDCWNSAGYGVF